MKGRKMPASLVNYYLSLYFLVITRLSVLRANSVTVPNPTVTAIEDSAVEIKWNVDSSDKYSVTQASLYYDGIDPNDLIADGIGTLFAVTVNKTIFQTRFTQKVSGTVGDGTYGFVINKPSMEDHDNKSFYLVVTFKENVLTEGKVRNGKVDFFVQGGPLVQSSMASFTDVAVDEKSKSFEIFVSGNPKPTVKWFSKELNQSSEIKKETPFRYKYRSTFEINEIKASMCDTKVSYVARVDVNGGQTKNGETTLKMKVSVSGLRFLNETLLYKESQNNICVTFMKWENDDLGLCKVIYEIQFMRNDKQLKNITDIKSKSLDVDSGICFNEEVDKVRIRGKANEMFSDWVTGKVTITKVPPTTVLPTSKLVTTARTGEVSGGNGGLIGGIIGGLLAVVVIIIIIVLYWKKLLCFAKPNKKPPHASTERLNNHGMATYDAPQPSAEALYAQPDKRNNPSEGEYAYATSLDIQKPNQQPQETPGLLYAELGAAGGINLPKSKPPPDQSIYSDVKTDEHGRPAVGYVDNSRAPSGKRGGGGRAQRKKSSPNVSDEDGCIV